MSSLEATIEHLARAMKMPTVRQTWQQLANQARDEGWSQEEYIAAVLQRQVADREASRTTLRIAGAHFPSMKTIEDFNCEFQPSLRRDVLANLATTTFIPKAENVILLGPPDVGKTHLGIALGVKACQQGYPTLFDTAAGWMQRLTSAHQSENLISELRRLKRYKLLNIDEVGYLPFGRWGELCGDDVVASAMLDRLVYHAEVLTLAGDSYRVKNRQDLLKNVDQV
ncbi:hypothetical protein CQ019_04865 [Arthrobacter sp. MYb229]|uniref:ATP-binding protein n=1 Tax=unclassified Arthrobacter TaxID=235627 RepID=UPI000CFB8E20|nr:MULTISPECIES: ATP-binding protein [unclassified Arthrobacter]PRA06711.1 hypothetical protein CQ019_04865 [Arthrobacter sp. MYb229]PRB53612.1 hypothetical protein CQ013_04865 [Arthrobacter sp. MYb216]